jgi:hypothetical protein
MPFTASNTDAETKAVFLLVTRGFVPPASMVEFMIPTHSRTGSGGLAET